VELKILQTPVRFYPFVGGVENYVYYLSKEMVKIGHQITVICANESNSREEEIINGIKVKRLPYIGKIANTNITLKLPFTMLNIEFDVVHTHLPTPWSADWSAFISRIKKKPLVVTYHNDITGSGIANYVAKFYNLTSLKFLLKQANRIIVTQSKYIDSSPYLNRYRNEIKVVPIGVDVNKFKPIKVDKNENTIFFLSVLDKFHKYKGLDYLLNALKIVRRDICDVKLIIGGKGELINRYRRIVELLDLKNNVEFHGFIPNEKIVEYYNKCSIFVLPSISSAQEGFGIVLLEALACGTPIVSTDIVGVAEDVKENNAGIIVPPRNPDALADAIIYLLENKDLARKMGENGRRLVEEKYTWKRIAEMTEKIYEEVIESRKQ